MLAGLLSLAVALVPGPQGRREQALEDFRRERERALIYSGQRHLEYGLDLRDKGLTTQAAAQIVLAVEVSEGLNPGAGTVLALMRRLDDAFWKRKLARPSASRLEAYEEKARKLRIEDQEDRLGIVRLAEKKKLDEEAFGELSALLLAVDEPLVFDGGALVLAGGSVKGALAERVRASAIEINGRPYARDAFLQKLPDLAGIFEASSDELRVRATTSLEDAERLHAPCAALLPVLRDAMGAAPDRRLQLVLLGEREGYSRYLDAVNLPAHKAADGYADRVTGTAVLCPQGSTEERVTGLALHELAHLYQLSVSPAVFPSWYLEGFAETYGGEGAFRWDGEILSTRQPLAAERLRDLRAGLVPLRTLLAGDALALLGRDRAAASNFYAQSWAFLRFLEQGAGEAVAARLERWRAMCLGSAIGADLSAPYRMDPAASQKLFLDEFDADLERLEGEFAAWLAKQ